MISNVRISERNACPWSNVIEAGLQKALSKLQVIRVNALDEYSWQLLV